MLFEFAMLFPHSQAPPMKILPICQGSSEIPSKKKKKSRLFLSVRLDPYTLRNTQWSLPHDTLSCPTACCKPGAGPAGVLPLNIKHTTPPRAGVR